ncbi:hypothetical protein [Celeribacter sp.]|uniref:hypothetical protein n=1 Tax=Celeribacter sp. TaxID=1890673 RepID=UPI003A8DB54F
MTSSYRLGYRFTDRNGVLIEDWQRPGESDAAFYARFDHAVQTERPPVALIYFIPE